MAKRYAIRSYTIMLYVYTTLALMVLVAGWEGSRTNAAVVAREIPQESIRLRILANSDAPRDQWMKRQIRDAIVGRMNAWVQGPQDIETARATVRAHLGELDAVVGNVLQRYGFDDKYSVELDLVPFPTKMYGDRVYPAGEYEALLVTVGRGEGQNWWCVLFPPLCFIDMTAGEAVVQRKSGMAGEPAPAGKSEAAAIAGEGGSAFVSGEAAAGAKAAAEITDRAEIRTASLKESKPEVRFFVWEVLRKAGGWVKSRFLA